MPSSKSHLCPDGYNNLKTLTARDYSNHSKEVCSTFQLYSSLSWCHCCLSHTLYAIFRRFFVLHLEQCSNSPHLELIRMTVTQKMTTTIATRVVKRTTQTWFNSWPQSSAQRKEIWHCFFSVCTKCYGLHFKNLANDVCEIYGCKERDIFTSSRRQEERLCNMQVPTEYHVSDMTHRLWMSFMEVH